MDEFVVATQTMEPGIVALSVKGFVDIVNAQELSNTFEDCIEQGVYRFIVDLSQVNYIGSAGIGSFISVLDTLKENNGTIVFLHPNSSVQSVFHIFNLSKFYSITNDLALALKQLRDMDKTGK